MKIKLPKGFNKMNLQEQEDILVKNLSVIYALEKEVREALGKIRGGNKIQVSEIDRPDEALLKE